MTMQVRPFAFDRVFSAGAEAARDAAQLATRVAALELQLSQQAQEREAQITRARAEGYQEALEQVRGERELAVLSAADALHAALEALDGRWREIESVAARQAAELALDAADYLAGQALARDPGTAVDAAIGRALRQVRRGQPILVRVHPDLVPDIERLVAERQLQDRRRLELAVVGDPALPLGDAQLCWDEGSLALDVAARRAALVRELDSLYPPR
jgi:flagellar assembly protein FliH